jgi:hypothetical protein
MEYVDDYGPAADVPYDAIIAKFREVYPLEGMFDSLEQAGNGREKISADGDFEAEIEAEAQGARDQAH